jgi:ABC-type multidrug transport system ATPase subunit
MAILNGGKILAHLTPKEATQKLAGQIWTRDIPREELATYESSFNVISSNFNQDNSLNIRVHSLTKPDDTFSEKIPELEDVYFVTLHEDQNATLAEA